VEKQFFREADRRNDVTQATERLTAKDGLFKPTGFGRAPYQVVSDWADKQSFTMLHRKRGLSCSA